MKFATLLTPSSVYMSRTPLLHRQYLVYDSGDEIDQTAHQSILVRVFPADFLNRRVRTMTIQTSLYIFRVNPHVCLPNNATPFALWDCEQWRQDRICMGPLVQRHRQLTCRSGFLMFTICTRTRLKPIACFRHRNRWIGVFNKVDCS